MIRKLFLAVIFALLLLPAQAAVAKQGSPPSSENVKTRLDKKEIIALMAKSARMPAAQQDRRLDRVLRYQSRSKTPRSDFLFCAGPAYLGNYKAQKCLGTAYEKGIGIVVDFDNAYIWYSLALENRPSDKDLQADRQRVQTRLQIFYPSPTDEELEERVKVEKKRIEQYRSAVKEGKN